jgi:hypothetical protein
LEGGGDLLLVIGFCSSCDDEAETAETVLEWLEAAGDGGRDIAVYLLDKDVDVYKWSTGFHVVNDVYIAALHGSAHGQLLVVNEPPQEAVVVEWFRKVKSRLPSVTAFAA